MFRRTTGLEPSTTTRRRMLLGLGAGVVGSAAGTGAAAPGDGRGRGLSVAASFVDFGVTGVAVDGQGRTFVNQPRFPWLVSDQGNRPRDVTNVDISVAEVRGGNSLVPYPNEEWNRDGYDQAAGEWNADGFPPRETFVNVQSVYVDPDDPDDLWVLDTGNPELSGGSGVVRPGGPKLVRIDTRTDEVEQRVFLDDPALTPERDREAYLNDVRVSKDQGFAFLTDSELGALVVIDLDDSDESRTEARRLFDDATETSAEPGVAVEVGPHEGQQEPASIPGVNADGIAIDPDDEYVYFHSLSGFELYRSPLEELADFSLEQKEITIQNPARTDATDGMIADGEGIYHTALGLDAVTRWNYGSGDGTETVVEDSKRLHWPDSFAFGPDGDLYVTTSKIHLESTGTRRRPFRVLRVGAGKL